ncbi:MAG: SOS response-associated peptidase [Methyloligellaceae bacterium]
MCGRFALKVSWEELEEWYDVLNNGLPPFPESYNINPSQPIPIIGCFNEADKKKRELTFARWGLIPFWWRKSMDDLPKSMNARAEGIESKPFFKAPFRYRRCLIPVSGFYEWKGSKSPKQPWYISGARQPLLTFAGLYEEWIEPASGCEVLSATIITTEANNFMKSIHRRMPVILQTEHFNDWLHGETSELLKPCAENILQAWPVSNRVNSAGYNTADCIQPHEDNPGLL